MPKEIVGPENLPSQIYASPTGELANHLRLYATFAHFKSGGVVFCHSREEESVLANLVGSLHIERSDNKKHYVAAVDIPDQEQYDNALKQLSHFGLEPEKLRKEDYKLNDRLRAYSNSNH